MQKAKFKIDLFANKIGDEINIINIESSIDMTLMLTIYYVNKQGQLDLLRLEGKEVNNILEFII